MMKASKLTIAALRSGKFRHGHQSRMDMVGHTGVRDAAVQAVESVDQSLARLLACIKELGGVALVTADHGNCEEMYMRDKTGAFTLNDDGTPRARTSHTTHPVPLSLYDARTTARPSLARPSKTVWPTSATVMNLGCQKISTVSSTFQTTKATPLLRFLFFGLMLVSTVVAYLYQCDTTSRERPNASAAGS